MSAEENKIIVRRFYEEVHGQGNLGAIEMLFSPDCPHHNAGQDVDQSWLVQSIRQLWSAFPDRHTTLDDLFAEEDRVVSRWTFRGTQAQPFRGIAPTGKAVTLTGITIRRLANGKIVEVWNSADSLGLLQQLGVVPSSR